VQLGESRGCGGRFEVKIIGVSLSNGQRWRWLGADLAKNIGGVSESRAKGTQPCREEKERWLETTATSTLLLGLRWLPSSLAERGRG
jgi:hypothetical protein